MKEIVLNVTIKVSDNMRKENVAELQQNVLNSLIHTVNTIGLVGDGFEGHTELIEVEAKGLTTLAEKF